MTIYAVNRLGSPELYWTSFFHFVLAIASSSFNTLFPYLFYASLPTWFSVFLSFPFPILVQMTFFLVSVLRPFPQYKQYLDILSFVPPASPGIYGWWCDFLLYLTLSIACLACIFLCCFQSSCLSFCSSIHPLHYICFSPHHVSVPFRLPFRALFGNLRHYRCLADSFVPDLIIVCH